MATRIASCSCGQLTVTVTEDPIRVSVCHCLACQPRTGSVFGAQAPFRRDCRAIKGQSKQCVRSGDAGSRIRFNFCPSCGGTVRYTIEDREEYVAVPVGAFAEPGFPAAAFAVYEERKHAWVGLPRTSSIWRREE